MKATLTVNKEKAVSKIDPRLYGSFLEHLGRAVYHGIYEPTHATADDCGFRADVMNLVKEINVPVVRYPGGNFVSGYHWEAGIGDRAKRPKKLDLAWNSVETNEIGIDEFQEWAKRAGTDVMMTVNLGTRGPDEARALLEYCNGTTDTYYAELRRKNGFAQPFGIKLWCLGNEMDGPWQMGHKTAREYARTAHETAKMMKWTDPSIELVACGSSNPYMPTFGEWERTVLAECYDAIDYLSLHSYYGNSENDSPAYLALGLEMDGFIKDTAKICDEIKEQRGSEKTVQLSFDEWNVWFHSHDKDKQAAPWSVAPPLLEDEYNFEDALLVGTLLNTLINNADRVKIACLAQLVNVIAPIMTENDGSVWVQTTFYPYLYASRYGRGTALKAECRCPAYPTEKFAAVPFVDTAAVLAEDGKSLTVFAVNRSLDEPAEFALEASGFDGLRLTKHVALECGDLKAVNTADRQPVAPVEKPLSGPLSLAPHSWNMLVYAAE